MTKSAADIGTPTTTRRRRNSLIDVAATLPNLDASLDAFIAKVNSTDVDASNWSLPQATDATKNTIVEIEAAHAIEIERLKHRIGLEAAANEKKLEASNKKLEAITAELAATQAELATRPVGGDPAAHAAIADVDFELSALRQESRSWQERARNAEKQATESQALVRQLEAKVAAKPTAAAGPALPANYADIQLANDRTRAALAAARAAAAGIAVSSLDIDRIESGLPKSTAAAPKKSWLAMGGAFLGGAILAFGANAAIGGGGTTSEPAAVAPTVKPIAAPEVKPLAAPTPAAQAAAVPAPQEAAPAVAEQAAAVPAPVEVAPDIEIEEAPEPVPTVKEAAPKAASKPKTVSKPAAKKPAAPAASKPAASGKKSGGIVDPF